MSSPSPPCAVGMHEARKPSRPRTRHESIGLAPAASYSAARGAMCSRVIRSTNSSKAFWDWGGGAAPPPPSPPHRFRVNRHRPLAHALDRLAVAGDAAAGAGLMQLDHVAERVVHEDLLRLRAHHTPGPPVLHAHAVQLGLGLLDVGHREGHVRPRRILVRPLGELGLPVDPHEVDLGGAAHVHPEAVDGRDHRPALIGCEAEHVVVEAVGLLHLRGRRTDADAVMVELKHFDGHGCLLVSVPQIPLGRNRTNAEKIVPITRGQDSRTRLSRSSSTRNVAAPTNGPKKVPAPPRSVIMTTWPEVVQYSDSTVTTMSRSASSDPASPAKQAENTNDRCLTRSTSYPQATARLPFSRMGCSTAPNGEPRMRPSRSTASPTST